MEGSTFRGNKQRACFAMKVLSKYRTQYGEQPLTRLCHRETSRICEPARLFMKRFNVLHRKVVMYFLFFFFTKLFHSLLTQLNKNYDNPLPPRTFIFRRALLTSVSLLLLKNVPLPVEKF